MSLRRSVAPPLNRAVAPHEKKKNVNNCRLSRILPLTFSCPFAQYFFVLQVANALGYLHDRDIIHGRICSRNIFLEPKVQLSLLDYAVGQPNFAYTSPQLLNHSSNPTKADDVFAFGTLIFEIFGGTMIPDTVAAREIRAGQIQKQLEKFPCTEKLKRIIQNCWNFEPYGRLPISQLVHNFQPGSCLVRRHSTSEPRLDQFGKK